MRRELARIGEAKSSQRQDFIARWRRAVTPLGVLLPSGLGLKLDNQDVGRAGFVRCLPNGCVAEVVMDDKLLGQLRTAKTATFIIFETPEEGIGFPLSLNGIGESMTSCREGVRQKTVWFY
jgi:invasion protein IalB